MLDLAIPRRFERIEPPVTTSAQSVVGEAAVLVVDPSAAVDKVDWELDPETADHILSET